jgi:hypothetical protein
MNMSSISIKIQQQEIKERFSYSFLYQFKAENAIEIKIVNGRKRNVKLDSKSNYNYL